MPLTHPDAMTDAPLLHRAVSHASFDATVVSRREPSTGRSTLRSIRRRSIRRPAASRSTPARSAAPRVIDVIDREDGTIAHVVSGSLEGRRRRAAARSTGRGASITCSSTPASTCCRRRSIGCSACAPRASTWAHAVVDDRSGARGVARLGDREGRRRGQPHRLGGSAGGDPVRDGRRGRGACRCARSRRAPGRCA